MKDKTLDSNVDPGLDHSLRRFFWAASRVCRRDPRLALFYARAAARGSSFHGIVVETMTAVDSQHLADIIEDADRSPFRLVMPVVHERMLGRQMLTRIESCRNVVPLLKLETPVNVVDGRSGYGDESALGDEAAQAMTELAARRLLFGVALDLTSSSFPICTSRVYARSLLERGPRAVLYMEQRFERSCSRNEALTASQQTAMPLTLDLLRREFPALFLRSAWERLGAQPRYCRDTSEGAAEAGAEASTDLHDQRLVA